MDNRKDRQFYWEVKDFFNKKPDVNVKPKTEPLVNTVKSLLETSKPKPAPKVSYNPSMTSAIEKAINNSQQIRKAGTPEIAAFTKNIAGNPFRSLSESVKNLYEQEEEEKFDPELLKSKARELGDTQTQINQMGDINTASPEQRKEYVRLRDQEAAAKVIRDRQLELQKQDEEETEEAEAQVAGSTIKTTDTGAKYGVKPDFVKEREAQAKPATPGVDVEGPAVPTAEEEREAAARAQKEKETAAATQAKPEEKKEPTEDEKYSSARTDFYKKQNLKKKQEAEQRLAAIEQLDTSKMSQSGRMKVARNKMKFQQQLRGDNDLSDDEISKRVSRDLQGRKQAGVKTAAPVGTQAPSGTQAPKQSGMGNLGASPEAIAAANKSQSGSFGGTKPVVSSTTTGMASPTTGAQVSQRANAMTNRSPGAFEQMASKPASLANFVQSSENDNLEPGFRELNRMNAQAGSINTIKPAEPVKQTKASSYRI